MIIITTIGRSGSSFLTLFLAECGLDVGSEKWFEQYLAGMENKEALQINATLIRHIIKGESVNMWYLWGDIHKLECDVVKDPQFLMDPMLLKNWWHVRKDIKVVLLHRDFEAIKESSKQVPEWTGPTYRHYPNMMKHKVYDFSKMVARLKVPVKEFTFPAFLDDPEFVIRELSEWVDLPDDAVEIWNRLRDDKIREA